MVLEADETLTQAEARVPLALSSRRAQVHLRWTDAGGSHDVEIRDRLVVGSSAEVGLRIEDRTVSRIHAAFELRPDGLWVRDLGSRNGTWIDGGRLGEACLHEGARVKVGDTTIIVAGGGGATREVPLWPTDRFGKMIGRSEAMRELFLQLSRYAASDAPILLQGETGTGKELAAEGVHESSPRGAGPFIVVDCGALPENLLESELFGHARGAFTGAITARAGAFESAEGGTVFLDEIGELPLAMQPKLLRVLESKKVRRLGESTMRAVDVRFVAATHRDLQAMVGAGAFREDLYFRLGVLGARIPSLRERREDIPFLLAHFLREVPGAKLEAAILGEIGSHAWLGNVRELRSFAARIGAVGVEEAWAATRGLELRPPPSDGRSSSRLPPARRVDSTEIATLGDAPDGEALPAVSTEVPFKLLREHWIDHLERQYIGALARKGMNAPAIAEAAGLDRSYVLRLMRKHGL
jgi:two-component system, NtrC family, response regulator GlrR